MLPRQIPDDIKVELLLSYFGPGRCKVSLCGQHKRNAYKDIIELEESADGYLRFSVGRNSLYNALPEFMFHPLDRFSHLPRLDEKEAFERELEKQKRETELAYRFFAPMDVGLLLLRSEVRQLMRPFTEHNSVLISILSDSLTSSQRDNRFIRQTMDFLPQAKQIRGNRTLLSFMLRKVFMDEGIAIAIDPRPTVCTDPDPRYDDGLDASLGDSYVGNVYDEMVATYTLHYWSEDECNDRFLQFVDDIEVYRQFVKDWFLSVEEELHFDITHDEPPLRLSDNIFYNYLNYNTNV